MRGSILPKLFPVGHAALALARVHIKPIRKTCVPAIEQLFAELQTVERQSESEQQLAQRLCERYTEDFLAAQVAEQHVGKWAVAPYTHLRSIYLDALWRKAEYWRQCAFPRKSSPGEEHSAFPAAQRVWLEQAVESYRLYALHALRGNPRFDSAIRLDGSRVAQSERALRRAIRVYQFLGRPQDLEALLAEYRALFRQRLGKTWEPEASTRATLEQWQSSANEYVPAPGKEAKK